MKCLFFNAELENEICSCAGFCPRGLHSSLSRLAHHLVTWICLISTLQPRLCVKLGLFTIMTPSRSLLTNMNYEHQPSADFTISSAVQQDKLLKGLIHTISVWSGDPSLSYTAIGLGCCQLPKMHWVILISCWSLALFHSVGFFGGAVGCPSLPLPAPPCPMFVSVKRMFFLPTVTKCLLIESHLTDVVS